MNGNRWHEAKNNFPSLYGNIAFPAVCNFYGSISSILKATRPEAKERSLAFWFRQLTRKVGLKAAIEERDRTLIRGRNIDWSLDQLFEAVNEYSFMKGHSVWHAKKKNPGRFDDRVEAYLQVSGVEILANEVPVWSHAKKYKGRTDALAIHEGRLLIIDNKGSNKVKSMADSEEHFIQVVAYRQALREMYRNRKKDVEADRLLSFLPKLTAKQLSAFDCRIVYFVDGRKEPTTVDVTDDQTDFRLNGKYIYRQLRAKLKEFYQLPVVVLDQTEGFWRTKWKRIRPEKIYQPAEFEEVLAERINSIQPVVVNMESYYQNKNLNVE